MTMTPITAEITTHCTCTKFNEDGFEILDADGNPEPVEYCYGDCYEFAVEDLYESLVKEWLAIKGWALDDTLRVDGTSMGWRHQSGWALTSADKIHESLAVNSDFILRFTLDGDDLYAVRYSHDEPVGTGRFTFTLATDEDKEYFA